MASGFWPLIVSSKSAPPGPNARWTSSKRWTHARLGKMFDQLDRTDAADRVVGPVPRGRRGRPRASRRSHACGTRRRRPGEESTPPHPSPTRGGGRRTLPGHNRGRPTEGGRLDRYFRSRPAAAGPDPRSHAGAPARTRCCRASAARRPSSTRPGSRTTTALCVDVVPVRGERSKRRARVARSRLCAFFVSSSASARREARSAATVARSAVRRSYLRVAGRVDRKMIALRRRFSDEGESRNGSPSGTSLSWSAPEACDELPQGARELTGASVPRFGTRRTLGRSIVLHRRDRLHRRGSAVAAARRSRCFGHRRPRARDGHRNATGSDGATQGHRLRLEMTDGKTHLRARHPDAGPRGGDRLPRARSSDS